MLLDQKRTRRNVKILAIVASLAFVGALIPILVISVINAGGPPSELSQARGNAKDHPKDPLAWERLAVEQARARTSRADDAVVIDARKKALDLTPKTAPERLDRTRALANAYRDGGKPEQGLAIMNNYTKARPTEAAGFRELGLYAVDIGNNPLARLSWQRFLDLAPNDPDASFIRQRLLQLPGPDTGKGTTTLSPTPGVSPATP